MELDGEPMTAHAPPDPAAETDADQAAADQSVASGPLLTVALAAAGDLAYIWDLEDDRIDWVGDVGGIFGRNAHAAVGNGEGFNERINSEDLARRLKVLNEHLSTGSLYDCEYRIRRDDGSFIWVHDRGGMSVGRDGEPQRLAGTLRVITRRKQAESLLEHRANFDELTGHLNKARLREALQSALAYNQRYKVSGGYLAVGLDKLSMINDGYGHETADAVIIAAGQRIERCLRITDIIGRIGGDRFGVVLAQCDEEGLARTAEKILDAFRTAPLETGAGPLRLTVSIGGVSIPGFIRTAQDAMTGAESALQEAKSAGRNCFVRYEMSSEQRERQRRNIEVGEDVLRALDDDRIVLAYQPVVCARTRETRYYETLLRMYDEHGQLRSAGEFVPILEKLGLIRLLDLRALELAAQDLRRHPDVALAVNVSSMTVIDPSWMRTLVSLVTGSRSIAERLTIEITETAALEDFDVTARFISNVRDLGCKVALDDFGSGYTSFRHMKSLTVDVVKIDGAFVTDIANSPDNQLFVRTLLGLAEGFGLKTVAECIESEEDARILSREGADFLQGWHLGRPEVAPDWRKVDPDRDPA